MAIFEADPTIYDDFVQSENQSDSFVFRKETRVSSAITVSDLELWSLGIHPESLDEWIKSLKIPNLIQSTKNYQQFFFSNFWTYIGPTNQIPLKVIKTMNDIIKISTVNWANIDYKINYQILNTSHLLRKVLTIRNEIDFVINKLKQSVKSKMSVKMRLIDMSFNTYENLIHVEFKSVSIVIPWLALIALQEAFVGITDSIIHSNINDFVLQVQETQHIEKFILTCIETVILLGEIAYDVLKAIHPCNVGRILNSENSGYINTLFDIVTADMPDCPLKTFFQEPLQTREEKMRAIKLNGLAKIFTYPIVDIDISVKNVLEKSHYVFKPDISTGINSANMFKKIFIREYIRKHNQWPPCEFQGRVSGDIRQAYEENKWTEVLHEWHPDDFNGISILKCLDYDFSLDPTDLLADKSLAVGLRSWPQEYDVRYHKLLYNDKKIEKGPYREKRVIIEHLKRDNVRVVESMIKVIKAPHNDETRMFVMCLKERELSRSKGRYFTKLTFDTRLYQTSLESNMKQIFQYFPHQSMTMSGNRLAMHMIRSSAKNWMKICIDFVKWCLQQNYALTKAIGQVIDGIFGLSYIYADVHRLPMSSYCFFQDRCYIPKQKPDGLPETGPRCVFGLESWGEGMNQKLWTTNTSSGILYYLYDTGLKIELTASGDNQVLMVEIPPGRDPVDVQNQVLTRLQLMSNNMGLPLKLEETFTSNHYYEYGKSSYIDGKKIGLGLKKASRIGTESMEVLPSINTKLSGIFSTGVACASEDMCPIPAYSVCMFEACCALLARNPNLTNLQLSRMLLITRALGGLKVTNYANFCTRGIIDHAVYNASLLQTIYFKAQALGIPELRTTIMTTKIRLRKTNFIAVCKDPYALCVNIPNDSDLWLKNIVEEHLPSEINNISIKPLFTLNAKAAEDALCNDLRYLRPLSLKLASTLFEYSNICIKEKTAGRFKTSTSVNRMVSSQYDLSDMYNLSKESDDNLIDFYTQSGNSPLFQKIMNYDCPTEALDIIRTEMIGLDLDNPSSACPMHQLKLNRWENLSQEDIPYSLLIQVEETILEVLNQRGTKRTYLGSDTKIKKTRAPLEILNPEPAHTAAAQVGVLSTWVGMDPNLQSLMDTLIEEKTLTHPDIVKHSTNQVIGGTIDHRIQTMTTPKGAYVNYDVNIMSHIKIISDTATKFARKQIDYTLMFQSIYVSLGSLIIHLHLAGLNVVGDWGCTMKCLKCTREVYNGDYSLLIPPSYPGLSLGMESYIRFIAKDLNTGHGDPYDAGHMYTAEVLIQSITNWDRMEKVLETDYIDRGDLTHNTDCNISELARCDLSLLMSYSFFLLDLSHNISTQLDSFRVSQIDNNCSPVSVFMSTLIKSGHGPGLLRMIGNSLLYNIDSNSSRTLLFLNLFKGRERSYINIKYLPPEIKAQSIKKAVQLKEKVLNYGIDFDKYVASYGSLDAATVPIMKVVDLDYAPPHETCIRALRRHQVTVSSASSCTLETTIRGGQAVEGVWSPSNVTTYGTTAKSSQVWSFQHLLPKYHCWTINDRSGSVGVVMGHRGKKSYILDDTIEKSRELRINNGPDCLSFDECNVVYDREYYIQGLCSKRVRRPPHDQLLIILCDNAASKKISHLISASDVIISKDPDQGGALIGHPRRHENDVWYGSHVLSKLRCTENMLTPESALGSLRENLLSPYVRASKMFNNRVVTKELIKDYIDVAIEKWSSTEQIEFRDKTDLEKLLFIKHNKSEYDLRNIQEILTLHWIKHKSQGYLSMSMHWHRTDVGTLHTLCKCESVKFYHFKPRDELLSLYLLYLYKGY